MCVSQLTVKKILCFLHEMLTLQSYSIHAHEINGRLCITVINLERKNDYALKKNRKIANSTSVYVTLTHAVYASTCLIALAVCVIRSRHLPHVNVTFRNGFILFYAANSFYHFLLCTHAWHFVDGGAAHAAIEVKVIASDRRTDTVNHRKYYSFIPRAK